MTEKMRRDDLDAGEGFLGEPPAGDANPDEYMSNDQQAGTSEETGTTYSSSGEPESTPYDEELAEDSEPS